MILGHPDYSHIAEEVAERVLAFAETSEKVAWIAGPSGIFRIYVRNARRTVPPTRAFFKVLDLASISVDDSFQHKGIFTKFLDIVESRTDRPLFIENVLNPDLVRFLTGRKGWQLQHPMSSEFLPCFFYMRGRS